MLSFFQPGAFASQYQAFPRAGKPPASQPAGENEPAAGSGEVMALSLQQAEARPQPRQPDSSSSPAQPYPRSMMSADELLGRMQAGQIRGGQGARMGERFKERFQAVKEEVIRRIQISQTARQSKLFTNAVKVMQKAFRAINSLYMDIMDIVKQLGGQMPPGLKKIMDGLKELQRMVVSELTSTLREMGLNATPDEVMALLSKDTEFGLRGPEERRRIRQDFHGQDDEEFLKSLGSAGNKIRAFMREKIDRVFELVEQSKDMSGGQRRQLMRRIGEEVEAVRAIHQLVSGLDGGQKFDPLGESGNIEQRFEQMERMADQALQALGINPEDEKRSDSL